jgi:hypothetical protein
VPVEGHELAGVKEVFVNELAPLSKEDASELRPMERRGKSVEVSNKLVKINLLNSKISDTIKGFGAGVSGTSMTLYIHALDYMRRNKIKDDNNEMKCRIIKSIVRHVCGINIDDSGFE